jgi:iron complex transport system substrate-binding protein
MNKRKRNKIILGLFLLGMLCLGGCGKTSTDSSSIESTQPASTPTDSADTTEENRLVFESSMELSYAENFKVEYYKGGYTMLTTMMDENRFLLVPEGKTAPKELEEDIVVLQKPIKDIYLSASAAMDMFAGLDGLDAISFSSQEEDGWYVEAAKEAMQKGEIVYGGKYSEPDYELLLSKGCSLALENRMITHAPEVVEKLESLGIPVMLEYSTYESHPLGRVEWVKFFGALLGKEEKAEQIFSEQEKILEEVSATEKTEKTVAFFYVTSNGLIQVRTPSDYIPKMIELAGGNYIFADLDAEESKSTMNLQVEEFYSQAKDADFLIYNSSIDGGVSDIEALLGKCENLKDFKAVKEGKVWCTTNDMYQQSLSIGYLIEDMQKMLSEDENASMNYLFRLE